MKKYLSFLFLLAIFTINTFSQTGKIRGIVTDEMSGDALPGSNLIIKALSIGAAADFDGKYEIFAVPVGTHNLSVSFLGYQGKDIEVTIVANRTLELDIELEPLVIEGDGISYSSGFSTASSDKSTVNL